MHVPICKPFFDAADLAAVQRPLARAWVGQGVEVEAFERCVASYTGSAHAIACSSGTTALHLALVALGIGPGDEVIVPSFTWVATANAVEHCGATPIFCDIDLTTFNVDAQRLEHCMSNRTRALIPVHLFGLPADLDTLMALAQHHELPLVEDAACALGALYGRQHVGTFGELGAFSFHPRKIITTGEGGMLVANHEGHANLLRSLRNHGTSAAAARAVPGDQSNRDDFQRVGFNYRMTDLQAALGLSQMAKLDWMLERRTARARRYDELLANFHWLARPRVPTGSTHTYQAYVCLFRPETVDHDNVETIHQWRNDLMRGLAEAGVATRQGTHAIHLLPYFRDRYQLRPVDFPQAWFADRLSLALPLYAQMTDEEQDYVVEQLAAAFERSCQRRPA